LVSLVTRLWVGQPGFNSWHGLGLFSFATASRLSLGLTQPPPIQWVPAALSLWVKWLGCEADHSPHGAEVKNM